MSIATTSALALLLVVTLACAEARVLVEAESCAATAADLAGATDYLIGDELKPGRTYRIEGFLYSQFEESGFVPWPFQGRDAFEDQRLSAFCVRIGKDCISTFDNPGQPRRGIEIIELEAVGRYEPDGEVGRGVAAGCSRGTFTILKVISARRRIVE